jgi:DNA-binding MarR family transcriptional regulator
MAQQRKKTKSSVKKNGAAPSRRRRFDAVFAREETIGFLVWDTSRAFTRVFTQRINRHGLSFGLWPFLRALWEEDGLTQRELSERVMMKGPTTVAAINRLERKGLVRRVANPHDARKINVFLTDKGRRAFDVAMPEVEAVNRQGTGRLSKTDQETLKRLLRTLRGNIISV